MARNAGECIGDLHVFYNDNDWVIARDVDDAMAVFLETTGEILATVVDPSGATVPNASVTVANDLVITNSGAFGLRRG